MLKKISVFTMLTAFILTANCAYCGVNGDNINTSSDEVIVIKKDTPTAVTQPSTVTVTASPSAVTAAAEPAITKTAKPAATPLKKATAVVKSVKTPAAVSPEQQKINSLVADVKAKQAGRKAMMCDIVIKTSYAGTMGGQEVKGKVYIKKKDKFKVHYTEPTEQFLISNGVTMWVYTPGLKQVIKQAAKDAAFDTNFYIEIENSIEFFVKNSKTVMEENDTTYTLLMTPKDRKKLDFEEISVKIRKEGLVPEFIGMKYDGSLSEVVFSNVQNFTAAETAAVAELSNANFEFKTPEGVEEIDAADLMNSAME